MRFRDRGARLLGALLKRFRRAGEQRDGPQPVAPIPVAPPPLPPARVKYILYRCGDGAFDVFDGDQMVGDLFREDGDQERDTFWIATLYNAHFDWFRTLKAAKAWLGNPPVRKYRQSKTQHLDIGGTRERRIAPQRNSSHGKQMN